MSTWTDQNGLFINLPLDRLLTILAYGEAGNQGAEGMMAVLNVVRNRSLDTSFWDMDVYNMTGDPLKAVMLKKWQFSMFNLNDPVRAKAENWANNFNSIISSNSSFRQAHDIALMVVDGSLADNTGGATFYFNPAGVTTEPQWASTIPYLGQIGDHLFFGEGVSAALQSAQETISEAASTVSETVSESVQEAYQSIGETVVETFTTMEENPTLTTLVLAGLGAGILLVLRKKK